MVPYKNILLAGCYLHEKAVVLNLLFGRKKFSLIDFFKYSRFEKKILLQIKYKNFKVL